MQGLIAPHPINPIIYSQVSSFIVQEPPAYTEENILVWQKMVHNTIKCFNEYSTFIYPSFKEGFYSLELDNFLIPNIHTINQKLEPIGWQAVYVNGFVPAAIYALMLANQLFPVSTNIRSLKYFTYSAAPDFAHDVLGHLPMLFVAEFRTLLRQWATKASQCKITLLDQETYRLTAALIKEKEGDDPDITKIKALTQSLNNVYNQLNIIPSDLSIIAKYYGWSFEFGIIKVNGVPNIFGAAIISSLQETQNVCQGKVRLEMFNEDALKTGINYTSLQEKVFYAEDFATYNYYLDNLLLRKNE